MQSTTDRETHVLAPTAVRRLLGVTFHGRPGTGNGGGKSATTKAWMDLVRTEASNLSTIWPPGTRLSARVEFRLHHHATEEWDLDNLLKAFFDALAAAGFFGDHTGHRKGDERVDHLEVSKRRVDDVADAGARIELYAIC